MEAEFLEMLPHMITFEPIVNVDLYAKPTFGIPVSVQGRVVYSVEKVTNEGGQDVVARGRVYLAQVVGLSSKYRMTLPDGSSALIIKVGRYPDERGDHHEVVFFG